MNPRTPKLATVDLRCGETNGASPVGSLDRGLGLLFQTERWARVPVLQGWLREARRLGATALTGTSPVVATELSLSRQITLMPFGRFCRLTRDTEFANLREECVVHQDQRIGLALGVLLLGAAGAFFFRNDAKTGTASPRLQTAKRLDAQIAEKSIAPYLQGIEEVDEPPRTAARAVSGRKGSSSQRDEGSLPGNDSPDLFLDDSREPFDVSTHKSRTQRQHGTDDGIPDLAPIPIPDSDEIVSSDTTSRREDSVGGTAFGKAHVVQKGETLSSIAAKQLGSTNRFLEIYEANRDQLKDANDVRVGMSLRIPARPTAKTPKVTSPKSRSDLLGNSAPPLLGPKTTSSEADPLSSNKDAVTESPAPRGGTGAAPATGSSKKFVPAARPPLGTRLPGQQTDAGDPKHQAGRRLSQRPPDEAGGKVAR